MQQDRTPGAVLAARLRSDGIEAKAVLSGSLTALTAAMERVAAQCRVFVDVNAEVHDPATPAGLETVTGALCDFLANWLARAKSPEVAQDFMLVGFAMGDMGKIVHQFRVVATLTAVNVSGAEYADLDGFVSELRSVPEQIEAAVREVADKVARVKVARASALTTATAGLAALVQARQILQRQVAAMRDLPLPVERTRTSTESFGRSFLAETSRQSDVLVGAGRDSDFFAQRLDHIAGMLMQEALIGPAVARLASAHLGDLASEGYGIIARMGAAITAQNRAMDSFLRGFDGPGNAGTDAIARLREVLGLVLAARGSALPSISAAVEASRRVTHEIGCSAESFARLQAMSKVIDMAAINARIRTLRSGTAQRPMAVLSGAVIESAELCRRTLEECHGALAGIAAVQDADGISQLVDLVDSFSRTLDGCRDGLADAEKQQQKLTLARHQISFSIDAARDVLVHSRAATASLSGVVQRLPDLERLLEASVAPVTQWPDLDHVYARYTVQAERDVHDRLIGRKRHVSSEPKEAALDDAFF